MRKILLDLCPMKTPEMVQQYLKFQFQWEDGYGENLDALYDELTSITEDTCVGIFYLLEEESSLSVYWKKLICVFRDAEQENQHLLVIFGDMEQNYKTKAE